MTAEQGGEESRNASDASEALSISEDLSRENQQRVQLAIEATGVGIWEWNFRTERHPVGSPDVFDLRHSADAGRVRHL